MATAKKKRCKAKTKKGTRCKAPPLKGGTTCLAHADEETRDSARFGGLQPGSGRPRSPRAVDVLRERIEGDLDRWLAPIEDALSADRGLVVGTGEDAEVALLPDHRARLRAVFQALDRAYGRPALAVEHSGPDGGPIEVSEMMDLSQLTDDQLGALQKLMQDATAADR